MTDELIKRLRNPIHAEDVMRCWDNRRKYIAEGGGGSWPRDAFEATLDDIDSVRDEAADALEAQAKRIAELEAELEDASTLAFDIDGSRRLLEGRLALSEADLAAAREALLEAVDDSIEFPDDTSADILDALRRNGWMVAVHNDYRLDGVSHTFYLFTHPAGIWAKGEAETDVVALDRARSEAIERMFRFRQLTDNMDFLVEP